MASEVTDDDQLRPMAVAELNALLDAAVDAIVVIDEHGNITTFNAAAERMFGHTAASMLGKNISLLMTEPHRSGHEGYLRNYAATGNARIIGIGREVQARRADGSVFPIMLSVGEAADAGKRRFVGILRDLTAQREAEQRARSLEQRLAHVGRFNLMGEMAAGIAHEINQPLSAIATYAQAAKRIMQRDTLDTATLSDVCGKIDDQARRASQVIENLRKFIRQQEIKTQSLDANQVIADVWNLIEADARVEGIPVKHVAERALPKVRADAVQLQQVLLNLTRNSVDSMRGGLAKDRGIVVATSVSDEGGVRITVTDHGHGVPRQLGDNIFHPFVTTKRDGLGVGLAISKTIVQSCGGTLTYADNPAGGAVFTIDLPPDTEEGTS